MPSEEETVVNSHSDTEIYLTLDLPLPFTLNHPQHIETVPAFGCLPLQSTAPYSSTSADAAVGLWRVKNLIKSLNEPFCLCSHRYDAQEQSCLWLKDAEPFASTIHWKLTLPKMLPVSIYYAGIKTAAYGELCRVDTELVSQR